MNVRATMEGAVVGEELMERGGQRRLSDLTDTTLNTLRHGSEDGSPT